VNEKCDIKAAGILTAFKCWNSIIHNDCIKIEHVRHGILLKQQSSVTGSSFIMHFLQGTIRCIVVMMAFSHPLFAECLSHAQINSLIENSEISFQNDINQRIKNLYLFKAQFEQCKLLKDSVYAKILHKLGILEYSVNNALPTENSFAYTLEAVKINTSAIKNASPAYAGKSFWNLAIFYFEAGLNREAIAFCDSTITYVRQYRTYFTLVGIARQYKTDALFKLGDYQGSVEEATLGITEALSSNDSMLAVAFYNKRAQAYKFQGDNRRAMADASTNIIWLEKVLAKYPQKSNSKSPELITLYNELANAYKAKALALDSDKPFSELEKLAGLASFYRKKTGNSLSLSADFIDFGAHYFNIYKNYKKAAVSYLQAIEYGTNSQWALAFGYLNLGAVAFQAGNLKEAEKQYLRMLSIIGLPENTILDNQNVQEVMSIPYKELIHVFLNNKTELLLGYYKKTNNTKYLDACISTALTTDSVIQQMRREQSNEQSKLYWRNRTRSFFRNAIEASFLKKDYAVGFYFMEASRAVILADKLNELNASSILPTTELVREQLIKQEIEREEVRLRVVSPSSIFYDSISNKLIEARQKLNGHLRLMESKYPGYYHYKSSRTIPTYNEFKASLKKTNSTFVTYFLGDTVGFVLSMNVDVTKMVTVPARIYGKTQIDSLLLLFSDGSIQNRQYELFTKKAHQFYKQMFAPLTVPKGRVIVCLDGFMLPFEALTYDEDGKSRLLDQYSFSYVFSAASLTTSRNLSLASKNFVGFAPVSFEAHLRLADLNQSAHFLEEAASYYFAVKLYTGQQSNRKNLLTNLGSYRIVNIFSHASAGINDAEPVLYMEDSAIHLSELQYLNHIKTQLVVLTACQTSAGNNAMGEGIYSLSRGFAAAGIPSIMATIWSADEHPVYRISALFHKNIAAGMRKDEALRLAKIDYLKTANTEKILPYFWANMIIMGNTDAITLVKRNYIPWVVGISILLTLVITFGIANYKLTRSNIR
jgi:CHAT domain-containing protein